MNRYELYDELPEFRLSSLPILNGQCLVGIEMTTQLTSIYLTTHGSGYPSLALKAP
jgi:hypothetical protein